MNKIKKLSVLLFVCLLVVTITGCESQAEKKERIMKEYATTYFNNHLIGIQKPDNVEIATVQVSIEMLKQVNELKGEEQYDISKLFGCKNDSYVEMTIDTENQNIEKYDFHLTCE